MSYCVNCGFQLGENSKFCPQCGVPVKKINCSSETVENRTASMTNGYPSQRMNPIRAMVCELCGSNDVVKTDGLYVCQHCGTKYTIEEAKKIIGAVTIDRSDELKNLYLLARRARNDNNSENAQKYYEQILVLDPSSWEAYFYSVYFQSMNSNIAGISSSAKKETNCEESTFRLIQQNLTNTDARTNAIKEVVEKCIILSESLFKASVNHFLSIGESIRGNYHGETAERICATRDIVYRCGDYIENMFGEQFAKVLSVECWKEGIKQHRVITYHIAHTYRRANKKAILVYVDKIRKYEPKFKLS